MSEKTPLTLDAAIRSMPPKVKAPTFTIDMSRFFPALAEKEPVVFTYRPVNIADLYGNETSEIINRQMPEWGAGLCQDLATIARCHIEPLPEGENTAMIPLLYVNFLANADDVEMYILIAEFQSKAGTDILNRIQVAVDARKKNSQSTEEGSTNTISSEPA